MSERTLRLGAGSAHEGDDLRASAKVAREGALDYIVFDCTSEKAISFAYQRRLAGLPAYDDKWELKLHAVLPHCTANGTRIIANSGGLDPAGAGEAAVRVARELGKKGLTVAYVEGADVTDIVRRQNPVLLETGRPVSELGNSFLGALAYGGSDEIVAALRKGADIVITPRAGDSEQFLAPMMHEFAWSADDWDRIGAGLGIGHLMECAAQVSGGYFADPVKKPVTGLDRLGFPIAEVGETGEAIITKLDGTGGLISEATVKEQLTYEIGDPANYVHAAGVVDFTTTRVAEVGPDRVRVSGTTGKPRPERARVAIAVRDGFVGMGRIIYGGTGCYTKARIAADIVRDQLVERFQVEPADLRFDYIGVNSLFDWGVDTDAVREVELRVTGRFPSREAARRVQMLVSQLPVSGPCGAAWGRPMDQGGVEEIVTFQSVLIDRSDIPYRIQYLTS